MSKRAYTRLGVLGIEEAFSMITNREFETFLLFGKNVNVKSTSIRLQTLARSHVCSSCGLEGKFFSVEFHTNSKDNAPHINMYATRSDGSEVLMTCDHTLARSLGGTDSLDNTTTMCTKCNGKKAIVEGLKRELILVKEQMARIEGRLAMREAALNAVG